MTNFEKIQQFESSGAKPFKGMSKSYLARVLADRLCVACVLPEDLKVKHKHCIGIGPYHWENCVMAWQEWLEAEAGE